MKRPPTLPELARRVGLNEVELENGFRTLFVWEPGPVLDLGLGLAMIHVPSGTAEAEAEPTASGAVTGFHPAPKINIGWAFQGASM
jgi:hypothetical protein